MKTLVIHPSDRSTDFLKVIYMDKDWTVINDVRVSKRQLKMQIMAHDRIVMLGHGSPDGLYAQMRLMIDSTFVQFLRNKQCVCIWCNADLFVHRYGLKGFYTGMILSDTFECNLYSVMHTFEHLMESNDLFPTAIKAAIDSDDMIGISKSLYHSDVNPVIYFNQNNLYQNL